MSTARLNEEETLSEGHSSLFAEFRRAADGGSTDRLFGVFVLMNLAMTFMRPQFFVPVFGTIQLPFLISLLPFGAWLMQAGKRWTPQMRAMIWFLIICLPWIEFAVNNRVAFEASRNLAQYFFGLVFPLTIYMANGRNLRRLFGAFLFISIYLVLVTIKLGGKGPDDFVGDENDLCLVFAMLLPLALVLAGTKRGFGKLLYLCGAGLILIGVVVTKSRGGFLGVIAVILYLIWKSPRRISMLVAVVFMVLAGALFAPQQYWDDMSTIKHTNEGTAKERRGYWAVAFKVFLDPKNIIWGVGPMNIPYRVGAYEPIENKGPGGKSIQGRQVHSLYMTLLPELGLLGIALFLWLLASSVFRNEQIAARLKREIRRSANFGTDPEFSRRIKRELEFVRSALIATNASWCGVLISGVFISVLYYPPLWVLGGISGALQLYYAKISAISGQLSASPPSKPLTSSEI